MKTHELVKDPLYRDSVHPKVRLYNHEEPEKSPRSFWIQINVTWSQWEVKLKMTEDDL